MLYDVLRQCLRFLVLGRSPENLCSDFPGRSPDPCPPYGEDKKRQRNRYNPVYPESSGKVPSILVKFEEGGAEQSLEND